MFPQREALTPDYGAARHHPVGALAHGSERPPESKLGDAIRDAALALGFARVGFCPVEPFESAARALDDWLRQGLHGEMGYLAGETRHQPQRLLPEARTLIVVALPYGSDNAESSNGNGKERHLPLTGQIARYARGADYHSVLKERLRLLADRCAELTGRSVLARPCVDTAPLLEREAARRAGIGFTAKSTLTIAPGLGSYVLLGELLIDLELAPDQPLARGCGSCTTCLVACPTSAFVDAYTLDARRCISYLTIELKGAIPRALRPSIGRWVFGCDVCQEVCPFNQSRRPRPTDPALAPHARLSDPELVSLLELTASGYRRFVKRSALRRIGRVQLQRNAAVALGNSGLLEALEPLGRCLAENPSALVRAHAAWALGRLPGQAAAELLRAHRCREQESSVLEEIDIALSQS
jgi:epoxyqueuosine reductase